MSNSIAQADRDNEGWATRASARRRAFRDLGDTPKIRNLKRRKSCRYDFALFCKTYNPVAFYLPWADIHLNAIARIEECVTHGAIYGYAMPRGSGKSTLAKMAALWAVSYSHCRYVFLIGSTSEKAIRLLESLKTWMRFNKVWIADFPEISRGVCEIEGRGASAMAQNQNGNPTMIQWSREQIKLPSLMPAGNFPYKAYDFEEMPEYSPTSGILIGTSGLTGDGIRGSVVTNIHGEEVRPDLVLADDPQTDKSAKSPQQNQDRYDLMTGAVLGMAGPDRKVSLLVPCTKIREGDMVSALLDRKRNALFRGQVTSILTQLPENMPLWEEYFQKYQYGALQEPPSFAMATEFYAANREAMDKGCEATWPERFIKDEEISAIQYAMNLYVRDNKTFWAEYMNDPRGESNELIFLSADEITRKQNNYQRLEVPLEVQKITAFVDVQKELLFYAVVGWTDTFEGFVLDYGTYPTQHRLTFEKVELPKMLTEKYPNHTEDGRIYAALNDFVQILDTLQLKRQDGKMMEIDGIGVDRGYKPSTVKKFIRDSRSTKIVPMFGGKYTGSEKPMNHPDFIKKWTTGGRRLGPDWRLGDAQHGVQSLEHNPNFWKTRIQEALATPLGDPGGLSLYSAEPFKHQLLAVHLTSSYREVVETKYGRFDVWRLKPGQRDDDFLDCLCGSSIMASYLGISMTGVDAEETRPKRKKIDIKKWSGQ